MDAPKMPDVEKTVEEVQKAVSGNTPPPVKKFMGGKVIYLVVIGLIVLLVLGVAAFYMMSSTKKSSSSDDSSASTNKVYKVGILSGLEFFATTIDGFKKGMTDLGYIEGKNVVYDIQKPPNIVGNEAILQKFVDDKVDLVLSFPTEPSLEAKKVVAGSGIPVIFANAGLDGVNLVDSIRAPGKNITGVQFPTAENSLQRFEIMHEIVPDAKTYLTFYLDGYPIVPAELEKIRPVAKAADITFIEVGVKSPAEIKEYLDNLDKKRDPGIDAIVLIAEPLTASPESTSFISQFALKHKIPVGGALLPGLAGVIFGYTPDSFEVGVQAADLADKVLKGTPAGTIPVISSENNLVIDYKAAQALGIEIPQSLISKAVKVIR